MLKDLILVIRLISEVIVEIIFPQFCVGCNKKDTLLCCKCYEKIEFYSFPFNDIQNMKHVDEIIIVCKYKGVIKNLIHEFKYKSVIGIGEIIAKLIYRSTNIPNFDALIPIPIHESKKRTRGFNQAEEISKHLSKISKIKFIKLLKKTKTTKSQMSIRNRAERMTNIIGSFEFYDDRSKVSLKNIKSVILVDDVVTTGSTLNECAKVLKDHGIKKVVGLVLASR